MPTLAPDWTDVMTGLAGLRLAIYDELQAKGSIGPTTLAALVRAQGGLAEVEAGLAWLHAHHLVVAEDGIWRARAIPAARERWHFSGTAADALSRGHTLGTAADVPDDTVNDDEDGTIAAAAARSRPAIHHQQVSWFDEEL